MQNEFQVLENHSFPLYEFQVATHNSRRAWLTCMSCCSQIVSKMIPDIVTDQDVIGSEEWQTVYAMLLFVNSSMTIQTEVLSIETSDFQTF